ncbi:MAG TPA: hypothetical protein VMF69_27060 [Gemmataceae bacterium]|nr:hypothetical protein [Gemmataceae bacterium]
MSSEPYALVDFHETLREMASAYLRLEAQCATSDPNHIEFWEIIQRLFPHEAEEESRLPDESMYVGDSAISFGTLRDTSAHRLIYQLCIETLEGIMQIAHEIVPNPSRKPWPRNEQLRLSSLATIPHDGLETLLSLILGDKSNSHTAAILDRLNLKSLETELSDILLALEMEYLRAVHRQAVITGIINQLPVDKQPQEAVSGYRPSTSLRRGRRAKNDVLLDFDELERKKKPELTDKEILAAFRKKHPDHPIFDSEDPRAALRAARSRRKKKPPRA